jgi:hypothetical protein
MNTINICIYIGGKLWCKNSAKKKKYPDLKIVYVLLTIIF